MYFLIERYADQKQRSIADVIKEWDEKNITQEIYDGYWEYHQETLDPTISPYSPLASTRKRAWYFITNTH